MTAMSEIAADSVDVVVVENSQHDTRLIREAFEMWSRAHRLSCFSDGAAAMSELMRRAEDGPLPRTLMLLDWNLPGIHGSRVLRQLRADNRFDEVYIVVFTSSCSELDQALARKLGANRFVTKAVDLDDFFFALVSLQQAL